MLLALACHLCIAILGQLFMSDIYELTSAEHGGPIGASFFTDTLQGLKAFGSTSVLSIIGIWLVKLNFLLFFYRLGHQVRKYRIFWWIVLVFCIACGAACLGLMQYRCLFGDVETIFVQCNQFSVLKSTYYRVIMTSVLDVLSDVARKSEYHRPASSLRGKANQLTRSTTTVLCFPISILWRVKLSIRKKILLSAVFGLVGFTIAVTIVRGSIFGGVYKSLNEGQSQEENISWIWFWFYVEFTVCELVRIFHLHRILRLGTSQLLTRQIFQRTSSPASYRFGRCSSTRNNKRARQKRWILCANNETKSPLEESQSGRGCASSMTLCSIHAAAGRDARAVLIF